MQSGAVAQQESGKKAEISILNKKNNSLRSTKFISLSQLNQLLIF